MLRRLFLKLGIAGQQPTVRTLSPQCPICKNFTYTDPATAKYFVVSDSGEAFTPSVYSCMHVNICSTCGIIFLSKKTDGVCTPISFNLNNRIYNVCLQYDSILKSWGPIPQNAINIAYYFNNARYSGLEFNITNGRVFPKPPWNPGSGSLLVDYDLA